MIDYQKCTGCETCEAACSAKHEGAINPFESRIRIIKWEIEGKGIPVTCNQCHSAPCQAVCPTKAISWDESLGRTIIRYDLCIGCRMCIAVCPFGAISFDSIGKRVIKCDLCDGDPLCAKFCAYEALQYVEIKDQSVSKSREVARKIEAILLGQKAGSEAGSIEE